MPAHSKSQQRLFGMIHAYQKGKLGKAPDKVKDIAANISPINATHFAATKHRGLREHVKKADDIDAADRVDAYMNKNKKYKTWDRIPKVTFDKLWNAKELRKKAMNNNTHPDEAEDKALIKKIVKPEAIKKEAFEYGFMKAALDQGIHPLQAVELLKQADAFAYAGPGSLNSTVHSGLLGGVVGGLGGAALGAGMGGLSEARKPEDVQKEYLKAILAGARTGAIGGATGGSLFGAGAGYGAAEGAQDAVQRVNALLPL